MKKIIVSFLSMTLLFFSCSKDSLEEEYDFENEKIRLSNLNIKSYSFGFDADSFITPYDSSMWSIDLIYNDNNQLERIGPVRLTYSSSNQLSSILNYYAAYDYEWENDRKFNLIGGNVNSYYNNRFDFELDEKKRLVKYMGRFGALETTEINWENNNAHFFQKIEHSDYTKYYKGIVKYSNKKNPFFGINLGIINLLNYEQLYFPPYLQPFQNSYMLEYMESVRTNEKGEPLTGEYSEKVVYKFESEFNENDYPTKTFIIYKNDSFKNSPIEFIYNFYYENIN